MPQAFDKSMFFGRHRYRNPCGRFVRYRPEGAPETTAMEQHATTHAAFMTAPDLEVYLVDSGINILAAVLILIVGWWLSKRLSRWTRTALDRVHHFDETLKPLISSLVRYAVLAAAVIAVLERLASRRPASLRFWARRVWPSDWPCRARCRMSRPA